MATTVKLPDGFQLDAPKGFVPDGGFYPEEPPEDFTISRDVEAKIRTADVISARLGVPIDTVINMYGPLTEEMFKKPMSPQAVEQLFEQSGELTSRKKDKESVPLLMNYVLDGTDLPPEERQRQQRRFMVSQTADLIHQLEQVNDAAYFNYDNLPPTNAADLYKSSKMGGMLWVNEHKDEDIIDPTYFMDKVKAAQSQKQVDELVTQRKNALVTMRNQIVEQQALKLNRPQSYDGKFDAVSQSVARGLMQGWDLIKRGWLSTSVSMGLEYNKYRSEQVSKQMEELELTKPQVQGALGYITETITQSAPYMAQAALTGGFGTFITEYGNAYQDAIDSGATHNQAHLEASIIAPIVTLIEMAQVGRILKFSATGKFSYEVFKKQLTQKAFKRMMVSGGKFSVKIFKDALIEGVQELLQGGVQMGIPAALRGEYPKTESGAVDWMTVGMSLGEEFIGGAIAGGFFEFTGSAIDARITAGEKKRIAANIYANQGLTIDQSLQSAAAIIERAKMQDGDPIQIYREEVGRFKIGTDHRQRVIANTLKNRLNLSDAEFTGIAKDKTGKERFAEMTWTEAEEFLEHLNTLEPRQAPEATATQAGQTEQKGTEAGGKTETQQDATENATSEALANRRQKIESHRIKNSKNILEEDYRNIAEEITGKNSIKDMTQSEADLFIQALKDFDPKADSDLQTIDPELEKPTVDFTVRPAEENKRPITKPVQPKEKLENRAVNKQRKTLREHPYYKQVLSDLETWFLNLQLPSKIDFGNLTSEAIEATEGRPELRKFVGKEGEGEPFDLLYENLAQQDEAGEGTLKNTAALSDPHAFFEFIGPFIAGKKSEDNLNKFVLDRASKEPSFYLELVRYNMLKNGETEADIAEAITTLEREMNNVAAGTEVSEDLSESLEDDAETAAELEAIRSEGELEYIGGFLDGIVEQSSSLPPDAPGQATLPTAAPVEGEPAFKLAEWQKGDPFAEELVRSKGRRIETGLNIGEATVVNVLPPSKKYPQGSVVVKRPDMYQGKKRIAGEKEQFDFTFLRDRLRRGDSKFSGPPKDGKPSLDTSPSSDDTTAMTQGEASRDIAPQENAGGKGEIDVESKEFSDKFAKSSVVTTYGDPKPVFHGTNAEFDTFDAGMSGSSTKHASAKLGIFFTESEKDAAGFGSNVKKAYLVIENPKSYSNTEFEEILDGMGGDWRDLFDNQKAARKFAKLQKELIAEGYDGIIIKPQSQSGYPELNNTNYVVFSKNQIISSFNPPATAQGGETKRNKRGGFLDMSPLIEKTKLEKQLEALNQETHDSEGLQAQQSPVLPKSTYTESEKAEAKKKTLKDIKKRPMKVFWEQVSEWFGTLDKALGSMSTRTKNISEGIFKRIRNEYINTQKLLAKGWFDGVAPFIDAYQSKFSDSDMYEFEMARFNQDDETVQRLVSQYKLDAEYDRFRSTMDILHEEGNAVGMEMGYLTDYFPRAIKDVKGLLDEIDRREEYAPIRAAIAKAETKKGRKLTEEERAQIVNTLLRGYQTNAIAIGRPSFAKERTIPLIDDTLAQYYHVFEESVRVYIEKMSENIAARKFFGKESKEITNLRRQQSSILTTIARLKRGQASGIKDHEKRHAQLQKKREELAAVRDKLNAIKTKDITQTIGGYVADLVESGQIDYKQQEELKDILSGMFQQKSMTNKTMKFLQSAEYVATLAQVPALITQYGEFVYAALQDSQSALPNWVKAHLGKSQIDLKDIGITYIGQEWVDSKLDKVTTKLLKLFEHVDRIGKETYINTTVDKYRRMAKNNPDALKKELGQWFFEDQIPGVIESLKNDVIDNNIKFIALNALGDIQPISIFEMPEYYAKAGNLKILYTYKSFVLKRLDFIRNQAFGKIIDGAKTGDSDKIKEGIKNLVMLLIWFTLADTSMDAIKDFIRGKPFDFEDSVIDNFLQIGLLSKYSVQKGFHQGPEAFMEDFLFYLPFGNITALWKDTMTMMDEDTEKGPLEEMTRRIPWIGDLYYWHMGGGRRKIEDGYYDR